jgi:hypothetical protein
MESCYIFWPIASWDCKTLLIKRIEKGNQQISSHGELAVSINELSTASNQLFLGSSITSFQSHIDHFLNTWDYFLTYHFHIPLVQTRRHTNLTLDFISKETPGQEIKFQPSNSLQSQDFFTLLFGWKLLK